MLTIAARSVLTPQGWIGPTEVTVGDDGTIVGLRSVSDRDTPPLRLVPGFVDLQVNGIDDIDVARAAGHDWARLGELLLAQGVTSWCPTLVSARLDHYDRALTEIAHAQTLSGPTIVGAHLEGPFLGGAPGAHRRELLVPIDLDWLAALPDVVRLVTLAPELKGADAAISLLTSRGIRVSLGHSTPSIAQVQSAVSCGAVMVTHLFNGMSGTHHREPGLAMAALLDDDLAVGLIADLIHVHPSALQLAFRAKPDDKTVLVTDSVAWRAGTAGPVGLTIADGAPRLADGTLAGSTLTMDAAIRNVVQHCGVSLERAVRSASTHPAAVMGLSDRGEVAVGKRADLVTLTDELTIDRVWLAGVRAR